MSNFASRCLTILGGGALLIALMPVAPAIGAQARVSVEPIVKIMGGVVVPGGTILVRTRDGVFATIHASGLKEGFVYTAWFAIFQNPEFCATDPCTPADATNPAVETSILNIGGQLIGADGAATFGGFRAVGDVTASGGPPGTPNVGLLRPFEAQIHLAVRTHGAASGDPAVFQAQLSTFNGGCPPNACANVQVSVHQP
jgi:hypothetical protein